MQKQPKEIWFPAMKYGVGWGLPIKWQGWVALFVYLLMIAGVPVLAQPGWKMIVFPVYAFVTTALFVFICWKN